MRFLVTYESYFAFRAAVGKYAFIFYFLVFYLVMSFMTRTQSLPGLQRKSPIEAYVKGGLWVINIKTSFTAE